MYVFNQGQALEQYYISIRNTIQLQANSHTDRFSIHRIPFGTGRQMPFPAVHQGTQTSYLKGSEGKMFLVQEKT